MKKTLMCIMASLLALSGCEKTHETVTPGQGAGGVATMEFTGISETVPGEEENISRSTPFSSGIVNWTIDDEIGVWDGSSYVKATVTAVDGKNVTFTAAVDPGSSEYVFVSPYECGKPSGTFAVDGSGNVTVSTGGTAQSAFGQVVMVGKASKGDTSVSFKNAGNLLRFVLDRDDVAAVTFKGAGGENVAGTVTVDPETGMKTAASIGHYNRSRLQGREFHSSASGSQPFRRFRDKPLCRRSLHGQAGDRHRFQRPFPYEERDEKSRDPGLQDGFGCFHL